MEQMKRFIEGADYCSSSRSAKRTITNAGKARIRSTERSFQNVEAAAKAQWMGYKVKARMGKAMKRAIPDDKQLEESSTQSQRARSKTRRNISQTRKGGKKQQ